MRKAGVGTSLSRTLGRARSAKQHRRISRSNAQGSSHSLRYDDPVVRKDNQGSHQKFKKCEVKGGIINGTVSSAAEYFGQPHRPALTRVLLARLLGSI